MRGIVFSPRRLIGFILFEIMRRAFCQILGINQTFCGKFNSTPSAKAHTDSFMLHIFLLLWSSTLQLLSLICSSGKEILNITSSQQRLDTNYQQMLGCSMQRKSAFPQRRCWKPQANHCTTIWLKSA